MEFAAADAKFAAKMGGGLLHTAMPYNFPGAKAKKRFVAANKIVGAEVAPLPLKAASGVQHATTAPPLKADAERTVPRGSMSCRPPTGYRDPSGAAATESSWASGSARGS